MVPLFLFGRKLCLERPKGVSQQTKERGRCLPYQTSISITTHSWRTIQYTKSKAKSVNSTFVWKHENDRKDSFVHGVGDCVCQALGCKRERTSIDRLGDRLSRSACVESSERQKLVCILQN
jgi:hypothetical protein